MKRKLLLVILLSAVALDQVNAQQRLPSIHRAKIGLGPDVIVARKEVGYGGSLNIQVPILTKLSLTSTVSYYSFYTLENKKKVNTFDPSFVPVKVGARYYVSDAVYLHGDAGYAYPKTDGDIKSFIITPGIGFEFPYKKSAFDFGFRFEFWTDSPRTFAALNAAWNFGFQ
ncbi:hypothetical protein [Pedobacter metabolipauper]|uniref:Outer membrane protein beta-barrel domain-containing protein n=1 Tax=Pedobacter metabolipauper TaxID=425513 RepID=A0A4R6SWQ4_9SPHI|nr:hypothetical protein [Pedobacter metabolipauper]TDQ08831.1 hypothetical protein ATK78_3350 [Pedobacter metabolipauper]